MKLILTILLSALSFISFSQVTKVEISEPIDIPKFGWNKVLLMKNGNTVLFHFEQRKSILVKVFDKDHKEIASQKVLTKILDLNVLESASLRGLVEINGQVVVFVDAEVDNKSTLLRLQFDATTGSLKNEEKVVQAESFKKNMEAYMLKRKDAEEYVILGFKDFESEPQAETKLVRYDASHQVVKEIPMDVKKGDYDYVKFAGGAIDKNGGVLIAVLYSKIIKYPGVLDRDIVLYYLAPGLDQFIARKIKMPDGLYPVISNYTYNSFSNNLNIILKGLSNIGFGGGKNNEILFNPILLVAREDMSSLNSIMLKHTKANEYLALQTADTTRKFNGTVDYMYTNERGLTTMVAEDDRLFGVSGNLAITQYDDNGEELWATMIPKAHFNKEETGPGALGHKAFVGLSGYNTLSTKSSTYILFNDLNKNLENTSLLPDSVYTYGQTNALFYKVDRKRTVSKGHLFGAPGEDESKVIYTNSSHFDDQNNIYAAIIRHREGKKNSFKIAWTYLEP